MNQQLTAILSIAYGVHLKPSNWFCFFSLVHRIGTSFHAPVLLINGRNKNIGADAKKNGNVNGNVLAGNKIGACDTCK